MNDIADNPVKKERKRSDGFPRYIRTLRTLCACYRRAWPDYNIKVRPVQIKQWQEGTRLGPGNPLWHPVYDDQERYVWSECKAWFEKVILPKYIRQKEKVNASNAPQEVEIPIEDLEEQDQRKEFEHREWERAKDRGEFIHLSVALATGIAAVKQFHLLVKAEDERHLPTQRKDKLSEILMAEKLAPDLTDKICAEFMAWDMELAKGVTDRREAAMADAAKKCEQINQPLKT